MNAPFANGDMGRSYMSIVAVVGWAGLSVSVGSGSLADVTKVSSARPALGLKFRYRPAVVAISKTKRGLSGRATHYRFCTGRMTKPAIEMPTAREGGAAQQAPSQASLRPLVANDIAQWQPSPAKQLSHSREEGLFSRALAPGYPGASHQHLVSLTDGGDCSYQDRLCMALPLTRQLKARGSSALVRGMASHRGCMPSTFAPRRRRERAP